MTRLSQVSAALAAASVVALSAPAAHAATVMPPRPAVTMPVPANTAYARPAVTPAAAYRSAGPVTILSTSSKPGSFAGQPVTVSTTTSNWQGAAGKGTQTTTVFTNISGKAIGAISAVAVKPPSGATSTPVNGSAASQPKPAPAPVAAPTAPAKPAASAPAPAAGKPIVWKPVVFVGATDQYKKPIGYYKDGQLVMGMKGPNGGSCSPTVAWQTPGSGGISSSYSPGMVQITGVQCYVKG